MADGIASDLRQEANAALLEVDKGLKSPRPGEQCEAIVRFPGLMDRFPFPVLINVAFLKLAEIFRTGSNLLRLNILKVVYMTQKHLQKITSTEELFRRLYSVVHSNDPIARALTLRLFAAISTLIAEKKNVHHSIWRGLESHDQVEVEAAILATDALCSHSSVFATGVYEKIASIIKGLKTPPDMKLKVIPVLKRMTHNLIIATQVRNVCLQLLQSHPAFSFVAVILTTLTDLSISVLVQAPDQIVLLLDFAGQDPRKSIRQRALKELYHLAVEMPQSWEVKVIERLIQVAIDATYNQEKEMSCKVLYRLSNSLAVHDMTSLSESIRSLCFTQSTVASSYALAASCNILMATPIATPLDSTSAKKVELMHQIVELLVIHNNSERCDNTDAIKVLLHCLVKLSKSCSMNEDMLKILISQLTTLPNDCYPALCKAVSAVVGTERHDNVYLPVTHHLLLLVQESQEDILVFPLTTMLLEIHQGPYSSPQYESFSKNVHSVLLSHLWSLQGEERFWQAYKIARQASKLGFPNFAEEIYSKLSGKMTDLKFKQWLQTLQQFSHAHSLIATSAIANPQQLIVPLQTASSLLYDCTLLVKGTGQSCPLHTQFLPCLASLIDCYAHLLSLCAAHQSFLLPFSSNTLLNKFKEIAIQLQSVAKQFSILTQSLFDADPVSLSYIQLLQQSCTLLANIVSSVMSPQKPLFSPAPAAASTPIFPFAPVTLEATENFTNEYTIGRMCNQILSKAQSASLKLKALSFSSEHLSVIEESTLTLISVPIILPPSFFVSFQSTKVQLVISPTPNVSQAVQVALGTHLALKVEGVIEHSGKRIFRSPTAVFIQVVPKISKLFDTSFKLPKLQGLDLTPKVNNDYFIGEFLLAFPSAGSYVVTIETSLVDNEGKIWHTGPRVEMSVLTDTEEKLKSSSQPPSTSSNGANQYSKVSTDLRW